jgi:hypothetical protein
MIEVLTTGPIPLAALGLYRIHTSRAGLNFVLNGVVRVHPQFQDRTERPNTVLLVIARDRGGIPVAMQRYINPEFPVHFTLSREDMVLPGLTVPSRVKIQASLNTHPVYASEFIEQVGKSVNIDSTILALSQSGETADTLAAVDFARIHAATILGLTNVVGSTLTRVSRAYTFSKLVPRSEWLLQRRLRRSFLFWLSWL